MRSAFVFVIFVALAGTFWFLEQRDGIPAPLLSVAIPALFPGFILRGLASGSEIGFQDWRDAAFTVIGSAAFYTVVFAAAASLVRRLRKPAASGRG